MNAVERLEAAIEKLETLKVASDDNPAPAVWRVSPHGEWGVDIVSRYPSDEKDNEVIAERVYTPDADLIVTLHRTIDAQLAILRILHAAWQIWGITEHGRRMKVNVVALADAILGGDS